MAQMNISITDELAKYVRARVKSGRYNNASEVVREAIRRMEQEDQRALRIAAPTVEDILTDLTAQQLEGIRKRVLEGIADIERGDYTEYEGREGLKKLTAEVKARGRRMLQRAVNE
jgi:antitoxin ParD1/3/4